MVVLKLGKYGGLGYKVVCVFVYNYVLLGKFFYKNYRF